MPEKEVLLTKEGLVRLEEELNYLRAKKRKEVAERIKEALEFGDITENSEYEDAKNEQAFVEGRIMALQNLLRNARVVEESDTETVGVGSKVTVRDLSSEEEIEYLIVGTAEADPAQAKISNESPVGKALMGHKVGDMVEIEVPAGHVCYQIMAIN